MAKTLFEAQRLNAFLFEPNQLTIVEDESHHLYDERVKLPLSESLVLSIMDKGVVEPIVVRKEGDLILVVDGRQRVRAAIEANKRLEKAGEEPVMIPGVPRKGTEDDAADVMVLANEIRADDSVMVKARKAARLAQRGRTPEQIAKLFGLQSPATVENWLMLLEMHSTVQKHVESGSLRLTDAVREVGKLNKSEQVAAAEKIMEENPTRKTKRETGKAGKKSNGRSLGPSAGVLIKRLGKALSKDETLLPKRERILIQFIIGKASSGELVAEFPKLEKFVEELG